MPTIVVATADQDNNNLNVNKPSPLVTLHNTPLASPNAVESLLHEQSPASGTTNQVRYGRSQSTMVLPVIEVSGESPPSFVDNDNVNQKTSMTVSFAKVRYSRYKRRRSTSELLLSTVEHLRISTDSQRGWRTRSPSPIPCGCYRCNVSELIVRSRELTPNERFNLRSYLLQSLGRRLADRSIAMSLVRSQSCPDVWLFGTSTIDEAANSASSSRSSSPPRSALLLLHPSRSLENLPQLTTTTSATSSVGRRRFHKHMWGRGHPMSAQPLFSLTSLFRSSPCYRPHIHPRSPMHYLSHHHHHQLHQQRSFSSPDTRPTITQPDPAITCTARRHRHSISGQMSYFKLLGYNVSKKLTGSANSLFSTAVISGSSSAPNLKDMIPPHASAVAGK